MTYTYHFGKLLITMQLDDLESLDPEKQKRKVIAEAMRILSAEADRLVQEQVVVRG